MKYIKTHNTFINENNSEELRYKSLKSEYERVTSDLVNLQKELNILYGKDELSKEEQIKLNVLGENSNELEDRKWDIKQELENYEHFETILEPRNEKEVWMQTFDEVIGNKKIDILCRNWNEEMFTMEGSEPFNISEPFHQIGDKKYASADDKKWGKRKLLVEISSDGDVDVIGEYDGCNTGIIASKRQLGIGKEFTKHLMLNKIRVASVGYSPEGYKMVKQAYKEIVEDAHKKGLYKKAIENNLLTKNEVENILNSVDI